MASCTRKNDASSRILGFLKANHVDKISIGDPGIIYRMKNPELALPFVYDGETLVTSARQINFGAKGAIGAVLAREVPFGEMTVLAHS